jgi:hypothetical protein
MAKNSEKRNNEAAVLAYLEERGLEDQDNVRIRRNRVVTSIVGKDKLFLDQLEESMARVFANRKVPKFSPKKVKGKTKRILHVIFSDTHYGSNLDPQELRHKYGPVEEARRTAHICRQVAQYKEQYRDDTELYIHIIGDIIQGQLHDPRDGKPLTDQVAAATGILTDAITYLAQAFPRGVTVFTSPGNHGRNVARHHDRAVNQKYDAIETMLYVGVRNGVRTLKNVKFHITKTADYEFPVFDQVGYGTHGDTHFNPGYPGKNVDVAGLRRQINEKNNARIMKKKKPFSLFIVGHVHVGSLVNIPGGAVALTNGCLLPPDAYAQSIGIDATACGQWMWESVPGHIVGDSRYISVDETVDEDESLDEIISPVFDL